MPDQGEKQDETRNDWIIKNYNNGPGMMKIVKVCTLTELETQENIRKDVTTENGSTETGTIRSSFPTSNSVISPSLQDTEIPVSPIISRKFNTKFVARDLSTTISTSTPKQRKIPNLEHSSVNSISPANNNKNASISQRKKNVDKKQDKTNSIEIIEISPEQSEKQYKKQSHVNINGSKLDNSSNSNLTIAISNTSATVQTRNNTPPLERKQLKKSYYSNSKLTTKTTKTTTSSKSMVSSSEKPTSTAISVSRNASKTVPKSNTTKNLENSSIIVSNSTPTKASSNSNIKVQKPITSTQILKQTNKSISSHLKSTASSSNRSNREATSATTTSLNNNRKITRVPLNSNTKHPSTRTSSPTIVSASTSINHDQSVELSPEENIKKKYCFCNEGSFGDMVECENEECSMKWFHYICVGLIEAPEGSWFCPKCRDGMNSKKMRKSN